MGSNSPILPTMPNSTNSTVGGSRIALTIVALCGGTTLLIHPSVPHHLRALREWGSTQSILIFGYGAHATAYLAMSFAVLSVATRCGRRMEFWAVTVLLMHAVVTETSQIGIPHRTWDPWDLLVNLVSVLVAYRIWSMASGRSASTTEVADRNCGT